MSYEFWHVDDNNAHDGKGPKFAVLKRDVKTGWWSVSEVDEGFHSEDKMLQKLIDEFVKHPYIASIPLPKNPLLPPY